MSAKCSIISVSGPAEVQVGQSVTIVFALKNIGDGWGPIRVEPNMAYPGYSLTPQWVELEPGMEGTITLVIDSWLGGNVQIKAEHYDYDVPGWIVDSTKSWPSGGGMKIILMAGGIIAGVAALVLVTRKR